MRPSDVRESQSGGNLFAPRDQTDRITRCDAGCVASDREPVVGDEPGCAICGRSRSQFQSNGLRAGDDTPIITPMRLSRTRMRPQIAGGRWPAHGIDVNIGAS